MRTFAIWAIVVFATLANPVRAQVNGFKEKEKELKAKLAKSCNIERSFDNIPLKDVLDYISDRYDLTMIGPLAKANKLEETKVQMPRIPSVSVDTYLKIALDQVAADFAIKRDYLEISGGKTMTLAESLSRTDKETTKKLESKIALKRSFENTPLKDVLDYCYDEYAMAVVIDQRSFKHRLKPALKTVAVGKPQGISLEDFLREVAKEVGGEIKICEGVVIITKPAEMNKFLPIEVP